MSEFRTIAATCWKTGHLYENFYLSVAHVQLHIRGEVICQIFTLLHIGGGRGYFAIFYTLHIGEGSNKKIS